MMALKLTRAVMAQLILLMVMGGFVSAPTAAQTSPQQGTVNVNAQVNPDSVVVGQATEAVNSPPTAAQTAGEGLSDDPRLAVNNPYQLGLVALVLLLLTALLSYIVGLRHGYIRAKSHFSGSIVDNTTQPTSSTPVSEFEQFP